MISAGYLSLFLLFLSSCGNPPEQAPAPLRVYVLDGGTIDVLNGLPFAETDVYAGRAFEFANPVFLVEHPTGRLVWDAGLSADLAALPDGMTTPDSIFRLQVAKTLADQLTGLGLTPDSIDYIALSHNHFDHSGQANLFAGATWLVQRPEYAFATQDSLPPDVGYDPGSYDQLVSGAVQQLSGTHDVFGDGRVRILPTPGHTPGHQSLWVALAAGPIVLSGDLYHFAENRAEGRVPRFNFDPDQTRNSMRTLEDSLSAWGARLIIQHDRDDYAQLPKAPDYLE